MPKNLGRLPLNELRQMWARAWGRSPQARIGRTMLEKSLEYKIREREERGLTPEQQARLEQLVRKYKRNPTCFDGNARTEQTKRRHMLQALIYDSEGTVAVTDMTKRAQRSTKTVYPLYKKLQTAWQVAMHNGRTEFSAAGLTIPTTKAGIFKSGGVFPFCIHADMAPLFEKK